MAPRFQVFIKISIGVAAIVVPGWAQADTCGQMLAPNICVVKTDLNALKFLSPVEESLFLMKRTCLATPEAKDLTRKLLEDVSHLPEPIQEAFCALPRVFIEIGKNSFFSGRTGAIYDPRSVRFSKEKNQNGKSIRIKALQTGFFIQLDRVNFIENLERPENRHFHKEFGLNFSKNGPYKALPLFRYEMNGLPSERLLQTVIHETGHLIDFLNKLVPRDLECEDGDSQCIERLPKAVAAHGFLKQSWDAKVNKTQGSLSWKLNSKLRKLCFSRDDCTGKSKSSHAEIIMKGLHESSFPSLYSMENPMEDFAESTSSYFLMKMGIKQFARFPNGEEIEFLNVKNRPAIAAKMKYLDRLYIDPKLKRRFSKPVWQTESRQFD